VVIGERCDIAPEVLFVVGSHELGSRERRAGRGFSRSITVGSGTWIGARSTFIAGASVGSGCVVAAGSVVTDAFPNNVLIGGVPAVVIRKLEPMVAQEPS
jgi:maltose O-acetyltransferase